MQTQPTVHRTCVVCRKKKCACEGGRPCNRCLRLGKQAECIDYIPQKRGRKPRNEEPVVVMYPNQFIASGTMMSSAGVSSSAAAVKKRTKSTSSPGDALPQLEAMRASSQRRPSHPNPVRPGGAPMMGFARPAPLPQQMVAPMPVPFDEPAFDSVSSLSDPSQSLEDQINHTRAQLMQLQAQQKDVLAALLRHSFVNPTSSSVTSLATSSAASATASQASLASVSASQLGKPAFSLDAALDRLDRAKQSPYVPQLKLEPAFQPAASFPESCPVFGAQPANPPSFANVALLTSNGRRRQSGPSMNGAQASPAITSETSLDWADSVMSFNPSNSSFNTPYGTFGLSSPLSASFSDSGFNSCSLSSSTSEFSLRSEMETFIDAGEDIPMDLPGDWGLNSSANSSRNSSAPMSETPSGSSSPPSPSMAHRLLEPIAETGSTVSGDRKRRDFSGFEALPELPFTASSSVLIDRKPDISKLLAISPPSSFRPLEAAAVSPSTAGIDNPGLRKRPRHEEVTVVALETKTIEPSNGDPSRSLLALAALFSSHPKPAVKLLPSPSSLSDSDALTVRTPRTPSIIHLSYSPFATSDGRTETLSLLNSILRQSAEISPIDLVGNWKDFTSRVFWLSQRAPRPMFRVFCAMTTLRINELSEELGTLKLADKDTAVRAEQAVTVIRKWAYPFNPTFTPINAVDEGIDITSSYASPLGRALQGGFIASDKTAEPSPDSPPFGSSSPPTSPVQQQAALAERAHAKSLQELIGSFHAAQRPRLMISHIVPPVAHEHISNVLRRFQVGYLRQQEETKAAVAAGTSPVDASPAHPETSCMMPALESEYKLSSPTPLASSASSSPSSDNDDSGSSPTGADSPQLLSAPASPGPLPAGLAPEKADRDLPNVNNLISWLKFSTEEQQKQMLPGNVSTAASSTKCLCEGPTFPPASAASAVPPSSSDRKSVSTASKSWEPTEFSCEVSPVCPFKLLSRGTTAPGMEGADGGKPIQWPGSSCSASSCPLPDCKSDVDEEEEEHEQDVILMTVQANRQFENTFGYSQREIRKWFIKEPHQLFARLLSRESYKSMAMLFNTSHRPPFVKPFMPVRLLISARDKSGAPVPCIMSLEKLLPNVVDPLDPDRAHLPPAEFRLCVTFDPISSAELNPPNLLRIRDYLKEENRRFSAPFAHASSQGSGCQGHNC